jgi:hypothetical protein
MESHRPSPHPVRHRSGDGATFEECEHIVRDDDPNTGLCGIDQTGVPWTKASASVRRALRWQKAA